MAQYIEIQYDQVRSEANRLMQLKEQHDNQMRRMAQIINSTSDVWKGSAQQAYIDKFNEMQKDFQRFSEMLQHLSELILSSAEELQQADTDSASHVDTIEKAK